jgi:hypothetical protein
MTMGNYETIMAGTQVQEARANLRTVLEEYERRVATLIGVEASPLGWDSPGFEDAKIAIDGIREAHEGIVDFAVQRVADKVMKDQERTA